MDAYTAVVELATAAEADHAGERLDYLAAYHPAITRTAGNRAELVLTLPQCEYRSNPVLHRLRHREWRDHRGPLLWGVGFLAPDGRIDSASGPS